MSMFNDLKKYRVDFSAIKKDGLYYIGFKNSKLRVIRWYEFKIAEIIELPEVFNRLTEDVKKKMLGDWVVRLDLPGYHEAVVVEDYVKGCVGKPYELTELVSRFLDLQSGKGYPGVGDFPLMSWYSRITSTDFATMMGATEEPLDLLEDAVKEQNIFDDVR